MTEWGVFGVIVALAAFVASIVAPILKLNTNITRLTVTMEHVVQRMDDQGGEINDYERHNHESHKRLWDKTEEQDKTLTDHEGRITQLEGTRKERGNEEWKRS